jgi:hypothetical protein
MEVTAVLEPAVTFSRTAVNGLLIATQAVDTNALPNDENQTAALLKNPEDPLKSSVPSTLYVAELPVTATVRLKGLMAVSGNALGNPDVLLKPVIEATKRPEGI